MKDDLGFEHISMGIGKPMRKAILYMTKWKIREYSEKVKDKDSFLIYGNHHDNHSCFLVNIVEMTMDYLVTSMGNRFELSDIFKIEFPIIVG